jgi:PD-(D/E)XK nuclease superfamily protein
VTDYVLEHKTTSEDCGPGSRYWAKLTLDAQISTYLVGARELGFQPQGVLYDVLRKPALRPLEANRARSVKEAPREYRDRCFADIASKPDHYFQRGVVVRLEEEERDAAADVWQTAEQIREARTRGRWPRNVDSCEQYHRLCDYWEVCTGERSLDDPLFFETKPGAHSELEAASKRHLPLITASSARTFRACARRYYFSYELKRRTRATAGSLAFGRLIHTALEAWWKAPRDKALYASLLAMYEASRDGRGEVHASYELAKAEAMMTGYTARWLDDTHEPLAIEAEFEAPLRNPETGALSRTFSLAGKLDGVVRKP